MFGEVEAAWRSTTGQLMYATDRRHISSTSTPSDLSGTTFNQPFATILPNGSSNSRFQKEKKMSNHFTGLSLGPPFGDQRLDLCDLYAFQSPGAGQQPGTAVRALMGCQEDQERAAAS